LNLFDIGYSVFCSIGAVVFSMTEVSD